MDDSSTSAPPARLLPIVLLLFIGSGCAALIYEIVWFQLLQLVIGSSAASLGVLLSTFMGGMCLGSFYPRWISPKRHPLRVYALLEIGIGILGIAVLLAMPSVAALYVANARTGPAGIALRAVACAVCLLPPTLLMGATLPAVSRWVETSPRGVSWLGFFYGGNTVGAVFGSLLAGFYLLRVHDMAVATYTAVAINAAVAVLALIASYFAPPAAVINPIKTARIGKLGVYFCIAFSGMSALGAEVVWTRLLSLLLGPTVYTFSVILAVFLAGLGIGGSAGAVLARQSARPRLALGLCQILLAAAIAWSAYALARALPYWPIDPSLASTPFISFQIDLMRCVFAIFPATLLWGASFPIALAAAADSSGGDPAKLVGGVYAANTLGAIVGALLFALICIPQIGTQHSQQLMIGLAAVAALFAISPALRPASLVGVITIIAVCYALALSVQGVPWGLIAYGRYLTTTPNDATERYVGEGLNSSVAVTEMSDGVLNFHVAGKIEASTEPQDMRLQRMLGDLPALIHPDPKSVLIVGCGAGVTAGSFVVHPEVEKITICEIEPLVPRKIAPYFWIQNYKVLQDPRVHLVIDDARHFVLTSREKYDIITSDPIHPWVKGAATLYTREYFQICKDHLNPGGIVTQWVPLYQSTQDTVRSEFATFFQVFPNGTVWSNDYNSSGYDVVLLGQEGKGGPIDLDAMQERLDSPGHQLLAGSLSEVGFPTAMDLLATYAGRAADMRDWLNDAQINTDRDLRLQYLAGWGMDSRDSDTTFKNMINCFTYPDDLFSGSQQTKLQMGISMLKNRAHR